MKKLLVANWKENPETEREALALFDATMRATIMKKADVVVCPPFVYLEEIGKRAKRFRGKYVSSIGAQDVFWEEGGPYTGEVGPRMLKQFGARYAIVGHSERRWLGETDAMVNHKVKRALMGGLKVILCVGESALVRRRGLSAAKQFVLSQLKKDLKDIPIPIRRKLIANLLIAYEPIWAIGTGRNDPPEDSRKMAIFIKRSLIRILHLSKSACNLPVLYGGSVNSRDVLDYVQYEEIDGALVGGASLKPSEFKNMITVVSDQK